MPITTKYMYNLSHAEVSVGFPISQLAGPGSILGPSGGISLIVGCDYPDHPGTEIVLNVSSPFGVDSAVANGSVSDVSTVSADADGDYTFLELGVTKHLWDARVVITSSIAELGVYWIVLQLGNNIESEPVIPIFDGVPPPPAKPATPVATEPDPEDDWGAVTISWTTTDDIADITGFEIKRYDISIGAGFAIVRGIAFANSAIHPNYSYVDYIGSDEEPGSFAYIITAYNFEPNPDNTKSEESDPSNTVEFDPDNPPEEPDIEIPDDDEDPVLDTDTGLLMGSGYGGIVFSGRAKLVGDFQLIHTPAGGINFGNSTSDNVNMILNPSGIYTLVEGKTHDTLYERLPEITSQDVKIPDPFVKTGFI